MAATRMYGGGSQLLSANTELDSAIEIVPEQLYFVAMRRADGLRNSPLAAQHICFSIDGTLVYEPFFADFGPLNLGCVYRFCQQVLASLKEAAAAKPPKRVYFVTNGSDQHFKANASVLIGTYCVLFLGKSADEAYRPLLSLKPFTPYRDASCGVSTYHLTVLDCLRAIEKARDAGLIDFHKAGSKFSLDEYVHYEQVENGDLNWIIPGKFIAFSGPSAKRTEFYGYRTLTPENYWEPFRRFGVTAIVRLNKKVYDRKRFLDGGFRHYDLYFPDGTCPTEAIIAKFLEIAEAEPGAVAVHCKAGLGRTGVLIGLYLMKHFGFAANEVLGYLRTCRPGMVIGPQQHFLRDWEQRMWRAGEQYRAKLAAAGGPAVPVTPPLPGSESGGESSESQLDACPGVRTSPVKSMHSGTRPSFQAAAALGPGNLRASVDGAAGLGMSGRGLTSQQGAAGRLRRSLNSGAGPAGSGLNHGAASMNNIPVGAGAAPALSVGARGLPLVATAPTMLTRKGGPPSSAAALASEARAPLVATLHTDTVAATHPASRLGSNGGAGSPDRAPGLSQTISSLLPPSRGSAGGGGYATGPVSPSGTLRLVTASGQPRKLPAAAAGNLLSSAYANSFRSAKAPNGVPTAPPQAAGVATRSAYAAGSAGGLPVANGAGRRRDV